MKIKVKCEICNKIFEKYKNDKQRFCSNKCRGVWLSKNNIGENNPTYKKRIKVKCDNCNNILFLTPYQFKHNKHHFCKNNYKCYGEWLSKNQMGENNPVYTKRIKFNCDNCGEQCEDPNYQYKNQDHHFCNSKCHGEWNSKYKIGKNHPNYIHGESNFPYPPEFNDQLKEFVRKRDNYKCQGCGIPQKELYRKLDIHHIDLDKNNCDTINLISLCSPCNIRANFNIKYWQNHYENIQIERKVHLLEMKLAMQLELEEAKEWIRK
jgi:endogenous inhibitor of DNA gyrase (YacG/DUF329 family)